MSKPTKAQKAILDLLGSIEGSTLSFCPGVLGARVLRADGTEAATVHAKSCTSLQRSGLIKPHGEYADGREPWKVWRWELA